MVGIVAQPEPIHAASVAELTAAHLVLLAAVDALADEAVIKPETKDIGLQLKLAAGAARTARS